MTEQQAETNEDAKFLAPQLPVKKPPPSLGAKSNVANKISSLIAPIPDDYVPPVS